jgi:hypothetical protein
MRLITDEETYHHLVELRASALETDSATLVNSGIFLAYCALP